MRHQWIAYAIVVALSLGFGVAIAGLPNSQKVDSVIVAPATTVPDPTPTASSVVTTDPPGTTTTAPTTEPAPTTTAAPETSTTTIPPPPPPPDRSQFVVVVANGANIGGLATRTSDRLETLGYVDVSATDGTTIVDETVVYYADPAFVRGAEQLAVDLGLAPTAVAPVEDAPNIQGTFDDVELLVYLGADQR